ncbi:unnamed protein product [Urochloa humidicola]
MASTSFSQYSRRGKRKRYFSYDLYVDTRQKAIDTEDALRVDTFKAKHKFVRSASYGNLLWEYQLLGHLLVRVSYPILSEMGKRAILSLLKAVEEHLAEGLCLERFKWPDVLLTRDGQVLFNHVKAIQSSPNARKDTVEDTVSVVEYFIKPGQFPADLVHLLRLMDVQAKPELYTLHPSLVPMSNRGWAFIQMFEKVRNLSASELRDILLKLPYHSNWRAQVQQNMVLQETYQFVPGRYDSRPGNKTAVEEQLESANLFLDFVRNGTSHRAQRTLITLPSQFELILFVLFPLLLPLLQEAIYDVLPDGLEFLKGVFKPLMLSS